MTVTGHSLRVGLLTPHAAAGPEVEIPDMTQRRVAVEVARVRPPEGQARVGPTGPTTVRALRELTSPAALDGVLERFRNGSVEVVAHASTTTGYVLGARSEGALIERLSTRCGVPAVASSAAAAEALRVCRAHRLLLVHPPWFDSELDEMGIGYFREHGFEVNLAKATELTSDPTEVTTPDVIDWISSHLGNDHEAVFLAGNGFRAAGAIEAAEQQTGRLVLQANQGLLWSILAATGVSLQIQGYGRLFRTDAGRT
jgi:maleate isomerase